MACSGEMPGYRMSIGQNSGEWSTYPSTSQYTGVERAAKEQEWKEAYEKYRRKGAKYYSDQKLKNIITGQAEPLTDKINWLALPDQKLCNKWRCIATYNDDGSIESCDCPFLIKHKCKFEDIIFRPVKKRGYSDKPNPQWCTSVQKDCFTCPHHRGGYVCEFSLEPYLSYEWVPKRSKIRAFFKSLGEMFE